ncbi:MAG: AAA family ATPase [Myxococcota bacterium]
MIERIYIDNFRCFTNFELRPEKVNLFIGRNGTGKTSLLEALGAILSNIRSGHPLSHLLSPDDLTRWDSRSQQRFELDIVLDDLRYCYRLTLDQDPQRNRTSLLEEQISCGDRVLFAYRDGHVNLYRNDGSKDTRFPFRDARSFLPELELRDDNRDLARVLDYLHRTRTLRLLPPLLESTSTKESPVLDVDGHNFPSWYRHVSQEHPSELHGLFEQLRAVIPGFRSLALIGSGGQGRTRDLVIKLDSPEGGDYTVDFDAISDGQRALIVLYTLLVELRKEPRLIVLDEPENFVGLSEIEPWLQALDDTLADTGQLMMISHHPEVIDFLATEHPVFFEREHSGPVRVRTGLFDRDNGLKASEQIARGLIDDAQQSG